ncbi:CPBP family glutamic-type intramembrane protease [Pontibacter kalidii]|uniref:CPBP family glutamic-type intramembrane protease n=1 Tax=Pontibacter kalidii TaxID=2592049 RepID=UPI002252D245|nr:CPBP family glutamic-type intramembrane protease [Pontibacter kalidii]
MKTPVFFFTEASPYAAPPSVQDTLRKLWAFALQPKPLKQEHNLLETKLPLILQLALIETVLQTVLFISLALVCSAVGVPYRPTSLIEVFPTNIPFFPLFVVAVLLAPVTEEMVFRLPLVYARSFVVVAALAFMISFGPVVARAAGAPVWLMATVALLLVILLGWYLSSRKWQANMYLLWKRRFGLVFYTSTVLFGLLHLLNYQGISLPPVLLLLLLLPKFIGGVFLGYTRLRLGMGWAVGLHMFHNLIVLLLLYGYTVGV